MNQGKLTLQEVGSKRWEHSFNEEEPWVKAALKAAAPHEDLSGLSAEAWAAQSQLSGEIAVERLDPEYTLTGSLDARVPVLCPRCGAEGTVGRSTSMHLFIRPLGRNEEPEGDDPDYIFLETPYIDLVPIVSEQLVAAEPVVEYPDQDMNGQPHECLGMVIGDDSEEAKVQGSSNDVDLNALASGQSDGKARNSPFAVLEKLKNLKKV